MMRQLLSLYLHTIFVSRILDFTWIQLRLVSRKPAYPPNLAYVLVYPCASLPIVISSSFQLLTRSPRPLPVSTLGSTSELLASATILRQRAVGEGLAGLVQMQGNSHLVKPLLAHAHTYSVALKSMEHLKPVKPNRSAVILSFPRTVMLSHSHADCIIADFRRRPLC